MNDAATPTSLEGFPATAASRTELLRQIRHTLSKGALKPGDRLPNERSIAERTGLSRSTVREALATLEREGLLSRYVGRGTFIAPSPSPERPPAASETMSPGELMAFRTAVEPAMVELIVLTASDADLHALLDAVEDSRSVASWQAAELSDRQFHERLYDATGNRFFGEIGRKVGLVRAENAWIRLKSKTFSMPKWAVYHQEHEQIALALHHRDADQARLLLKAHLLGVRNSAISIAGDL